MARVNTYTQDGNVTGSDKVLGTDASTGATKNFSFNSVSDWLNSAGAVKIVGQNNYVFQAEGTLPEDRLAGSISFENFGGNGTLFADVTELIFSNASAGNNNAAQYLSSLAGKQVILAHLDELANYGVYTLQSFQELPTEPGFYQATLVFINGSGALEEAEAYGIAAEGLQAQGGTWGSIAGTITDQTDLVNYVDAEIAAIPTPETPTLQSVTDAGNTTTNDINTSGAINLSSGGYIYGDSTNPYLKLNTAQGALLGYGSSYLNNGGSLLFHAGGSTKFYVGSSGSAYFTGYLGIGTTAPDSKLHIQGNFGNNTFKVKPNSDHTVIEAGQEFRIATTNSGDIKFQPGGVIGMFISGTNRNVGIGTTAPASRLEVHQSTDSQGLKIVGFDDENNSNLHLFVDNFGNDKIHSTEFLEISAGGSSRYRSTGYLRLEVGGTSNQMQLDYNYMKFTSGGTETMRITPGKVGIGTTAPLSKLAIGSQSGTIATIADLRGDSDNDFIQVARATDTARGVKIFASGRINASSTHTSEAAYLFNHTSSNATTTGDREFFQINGGWSPSSGTSTWAQTLLTPTINTTGTYVGTVRGIYYNPTVTSATGATHRAIETAAGDVIFNGGNVGIGTTAPDTKLTVKTAGSYSNSTISDYHIGLRNDIGYTAGFTLTTDGILRSLSGNRKYIFYTDNNTQIGFMGSSKLTTYNSSLRFGTNFGTEDWMVLDTSGNLGIGTTAPAYSLDIHKSGNAFRVANGGGYATFTVNPSATVPTSILGRAQAYSSLVSANNFEILNGLLVQGYKAGGAHNVVKTRAISVEYGTDFNSAGSLDYASGVYSRFTTRSAGSGIDNAYGFYSTADNPGGTSVTNQYGLYIADTAIATNNYGVYQAGASFKNIFEGNVGIRTTSPAVSLDVDGEVHLGPQTATGFPSIDIASNGRTTIRGSAPALSVRDNNNNGGYIDMGGGTLANINSITSSAQLSFTSTNVRFGGDIGSRVNIVGQDSSSQRVLGLKQGTSGSNIMIDIRNSSNVSTMGITSEGGFYFRDSDLVGRYTFDHDYSPSPADGLTTGFEFRTENASGVLTTFGYIDVTNDDRTLQESSMRFSVGQSTPTEIMRLQSDGNVGIGTTAPSEKLEVVGGLKATTLYVGDGTATNPGITFYSENGIPNTGIYRIAENEIGVSAGGLTWTFNSSEFKNSAIYLRASTGTASAPTYSFGQGYGTNGMFRPIGLNAVAFSTAGTEKLRITSAGNIGIGTTSPAHKLDVNGDINLPLGSYLRWGTQLGIRKDSNGELNFFAGTNSTNGGFNFRAWNGSTYESGTLVIRNNGNVGIGATTPAAKLDVVGTIKLDDGGGSVYVGNAAGYNDNATFNYNVGIGDNALAANTSGSNNIAVGPYALYNPTNTSGNVAVGNSALGDTTTGYRNVAIGNLAHSLNTSGYENVAIGHNALGTATSPYFNVAVGSYALGNADGVASDNTAVGYYAMALLTTGRYNTSLGTYALSDTELGSNNTAVGYYAGGGDYQGTNSVYLGMNTSPNSWNETNQIVIGYGATGNGSNSVTIGNTSITKTIMQEGVGVGVTAPTSSVHIDGSAMRQLRLETAGGPTGNGDTTGNIGDIAYDDSYFYIKTINGWGRVPLDFGF